MNDYQFRTVLENRDSAVGIRRADHATPNYPQNFALTSPTSGGCSVGIVRWRTKATELLVFITNLAWCSLRMIIYLQIGAIFWVGKPTAEQLVLGLFWRRICCWKTENMYIVRQWPNSESWSKQDAKLYVLRFTNMYASSCISASWLIQYTPFFIMKCTELGPNWNIHADWALRPNVYF
jgi:hypothetical protein